MKAVLLSAFVFPGIGRFLLKKYILCAALLGTTFAGIYFLITKTVERALQIIDKIQGDGAQLDIVATTELLLKQPMCTEAQLLNTATAALTISWLIGIVDLGRPNRPIGLTHFFDLQYFL